MNIKILGCSGSRTINHRPTAFLINDELLIDAGTITDALSIEQCAGIKHIILSHAHLDHISGLAYLPDIVFDDINESIKIYGTKETIEALRKYIFNNVIWPDFSRLPSLDNPKLEYIELKKFETVAVGDYSITPIPVNHTIPTVGYVIDDGEIALAFTSDTGVTDTFWEKIRHIDRLRALIIEVSFPKDKIKSADESLHLTSETVIAELEKLGREDLDIFATHIKPQYRELVIQEIKQYSSTKFPIIILEDGMEFDILA